MANTVKLCSVVCVKGLWGQFCTFELYQASMVRALYRFHVYYHVRRVLKRLQVPLPHESSFNAADNPYINEDSLKFVRIMGFLTIL